MLGTSFLSRSAAHAQDRPSVPFSRDVLLDRAQTLAREPHVPRVLEDEALAQIDYDAYRAIRFERGASIWAREERNFAIDLFYPGFLFNTPVEINLVVGGRARRVLFTNEVFEFEGPAAVAARAEVVSQVAAAEPDANGSSSKEDAPPMGYSGFRVRAPLNRPDYLDEFLVFQGASYFRAVAQGQTYGLSARGLAVRTARPEGEEFPAFTEYWIERPAVGAEEIRIHALLDSPSVVGAYSFVVRPGSETAMDVDVTLIPRVELDAFGLAPLTSMYLFDGSNRQRFDDFRPAVHDSDGLQLLTGRGERIWRALANPERLQVSAFVDRNPRGFGLVQRKREFEDFEDYEARYELRPSLWVEPQGEWGDGHVELVEIPTEREIHDNVVVYWQPREALSAGVPARYVYRLRWLAEPLDDSLAKVVATRSGGAIEGEARTIAIDFRGSGAPPEDLRLEFSHSAGSASPLRGQWIAPAGIYRVSFEVDPGREDLIELRLALQGGDEPWSETWLYRWTP
jgi:glucans biosynthesis protein